MLQSGFETPWGGFGELVGHTGALRNGPILATAPHKGSTPVALAEDLFD